MCSFQCLGGFWLVGHISGIEWTALGCRAVGYLRFERWLGMFCSYAGVGGRKFVSK